MQVRKIIPPKVTVIDTEYVTLWFYPATRILHHKIHKFMPAHIFRDAFSTGVEYLEKHKVLKWLSDDRGNTVLSQENTDWARTVWIPRAKRAGFKYWAAIMPAQAIGRLQMRTFVEEYGQLGFTVQAFQDVDEAMAWLESVDSTSEK